MSNLSSIKSWCAGCGIVGAAFFCVVLACSSSDPPASSGIPSDDASSTTGTGGAGNASDAGAGTDACQAYCDCYEKKCKGFVAIPAGQACPDFCSTFTDFEYTCRFNMCFYNSNGPAEDNNMHCEHTVGIGQCPP